MTRIHTGAISIKSLCQPTNPRRGYTKDKDNPTRHAFAALSAVTRVLFHILRLWLKGMLFSVMGGNGCTGGVKSRKR